MYAKRHKDQPITRMLAILTMSLAMPASALAASHSGALAILKGNSDCQKQYGVCLMQGPDNKPGMSTAQNATKMKLTIANANQCREALQACFETVRSPREFIGD